MTSAPHADELADRLDRALPAHGPVPAPAARDDDPLVELALRLARAPQPRLDEGRVASLRAQVLAHAAEVKWPRPVARRRPVVLVLRWAVAACLSLVLAVAGSARVSADSLPGDTLYPVKRLVEQGRLALASDAGAVSLRLDFADRRLDEFETLLERGEVRPNTLDDAVQEMRSSLQLIEAGAGSRDQALAQLVSLSERHLDLVSQARDQAAANGEQIERLSEIADQAAAVGAYARDLAAPGAVSPDAAPPTATPAPVPDLQSYVPRDLSADSSVMIPADATQDVLLPAAPVTALDAGSTTVFIVPMAESATEAQDTAVLPVQPAPPPQSDPRGALGDLSSPTALPPDPDPSATPEMPVEPAAVPDVPTLPPTAVEPPAVEVPPTQAVPVEPVTDVPVVELPPPTDTPVDRTPASDPATPTATPTPSEIPVEPVETAEPTPAVPSAEPPTTEPGEPVEPVETAQPGETAEPTPAVPSAESSPVDPPVEPTAGPVPAVLPTETVVPAPEIPPAE